VKAGTGEVRLDGVRHPLHSGVVFSYGPNTRYEIAAAPGAEMVKYFLAVGGSGVAGRLRAAGIPIGQPRELAAHAEVTTVFEDLVREGQRSGGLAPRICGTLLELLLLKIQDSATLAATRSDPARAAFLRCKALVDAEAERLSGLEEIAKWAGVEASSVCRWFRRYQGTSPYQYLVRRKMNLAAEFLIESGGLVKEAAQRVGFADPFHFSRAFKAVHGVPPSRLLRGPATDSEPAPAKGGALLPRAGRGK
jgi:AraC-like DNA-binding protein